VRYKDNSFNYGLLTVMSNVGVLVTMQSYAALETISVNFFK